MRIAAGITITLLILGGLWAIYYFWIAPSSGSDNVSGGQSPPRPNPYAGQPEVIEESISLPSVQVSESDITAGQSPASYYGQIITDSNVNSYNIHTSPDKVLPLIHFQTSFNKMCPDYVWYKFGLYKLIESKISNTGIKICYYKFDASGFPKQIKISVITPPYTCNQYKYYVSGITYTYKEAKVEPSVTGPKHYCIYERQ